MEFGTVPGGESPAFLESVLSASTEYSIIAADRAGKVLLWNEGARRIYGYAPEEVIGRDARLLAAPDEQAAGRMDQIMAETLAQGKWEGVLRTRRQNGETFPARAAFTVLRDSRGRARGFLIVSKDITSEEQLLRRFAESQEYTRGLIEASVEALITTDTAGIITDVNRRVEELTGRTRAHLIGTPLKDHFSDPRRADDGVRRTLAQSRVAEFELGLRTLNGAETTVALNASALRGQNGEVRGLVAAVRDVTEQNRQRERLEARNRVLETRNLIETEANRLKSLFLAGMSHELRTPLDSIIGSSDLLLSNPESTLTPAQREQITDILNSGNHLLQLINDILDLARVEAGKMDIEPEPFSPKDALAEVRSVVNILAIDRKIALSTRVSPDLRSVELDPLRFKQILYNLLSNAIKFTDPGGKVSASVTTHGRRQLSVSVRDTGIGIAASDIPRLFREFEQLDAGPGRHYHGSGLGLSLTKKLVDLMGGSVVVKSQPGVGSNFTIILPRVHRNAPTRNSRRAKESKL